jgi:hypothetical protein
VVRALLDDGADPTIADNQNKTPVVTARGQHRRACVDALEVRCSFRPSPSRLLTGLTDWGVGSYRCPWNGGQEAERAYQLWKARQVADQQGSGAVAVPRGKKGGKRRETRALLDFALNHLKGDLFTDLLDMMR